MTPKLPKRAYTPKRMKKTTTTDEIILVEERRAMLKLTVGTLIWKEKEYRKIGRAEKTLPI